MAMTCGPITVEVHVKGIGKSKIGLRLLAIVAKIFDLKLDVDLIESEARNV
jgi:hypothetical protein